ncbi:MAG: hypothetical protein KKD05_00465 [Candidatus Omnitrophica bacterium]|nr:hypothetical protein [Candidatus Omnitrophota bacterium]
MNKFKKISGLFLGLVMGCLLIEGSQAKAEFEEGILPTYKIEASSTLDVYNKYIWRGFTLDTDPVIQPGFNLSGYGFTISYWGSYDASQADASGSDEQDFTIDYTYAFEYLSVSAGHTYYSFPTADSYSKEWYLGVSLPVLLSPSITYYKDYGKEDQGGGDGSYLNLAVSHSFTIVQDPAITLNLGASLGFNDKLFIAGNGSDCNLNAGLTIPLTKSLSLSPVLGYTVPSGDLKAADDGNQKKRTYGGISLGCSF